MKRKCSPSLFDELPAVSDDTNSDIDEEEEEAWYRYIDEVEKSDNFEVGNYPYPFTSARGRSSMTGGPFVSKIYDASHPYLYQQLFVDRLLCFSRLAICFYNIREGTYFRVVKVLMGTAHGHRDRNHYITFQACSSKRKTNRGSAVTFQTHILVFHHFPCPRFQIMFVRIKPDGNKPKKSQPSEYDPKAQIVQGRLLRVIKTYTMDSRLDSRYNLALYLSQYALVSYNLHVLPVNVVKYDMESLKVLKLSKSDARVPTYLITFEAPLRSETERKDVDTFKTEICMPTLFPTTLIELKSNAQVVTGNSILQHIISIYHGVNFISCSPHFFSV